MLGFENRTQEEFFKILNFYRVANYHQKVAFMRKVWGDILVQTIIPYGEKCSITIGFDDDNKYYFDFDCKNLDINDLDVNLKEYAIDLCTLSEDELLSKYPEIREIIKEDEPVVDTRNNELPLSDDIPIESIDYKYLNLYNGISITKK